MKDFNLIGHRGYGPTHNVGYNSLLNQTYPENSIVAFEYALSQGADGIEFDVQVTSDGTAVVLHDKKIESHVAPTDDKNFKELPFEELRALDIGGGNRIPTVDEVLLLCSQQGRSLVINFDVKDRKCVAPVLKAIGNIAENEKHASIVSSYDWDLLREFRKASDTVRLVPAIKTFILFGKDNVGMPDYIPLVDEYQDNLEETLKKLKEEIDFIGLDCTFTDFRPQLLDLAAKMDVGLQISTGNQRISAENADYHALQTLLNASSTHPDIPFVVCKVDEPDKIQQRLFSQTRAP